MEVPPKVRRSILKNRKNRGMFHAVYPATYIKASANLGACVAWSYFVVPTLSQACIFQNCRLEATPSPNMNVVLKSSSFDKVIFTEESDHAEFWR